MAEYSRVAKGSFTAASGQTAAVIALPFAPDFVEVWNLTNIANAASAGNILRAYWDNNLPPFTPSGKSASSTMVEVYNSTPAVIYDTIYTNGVTGGTTPASGITTFSGGLLLQYGATLTVTTISKATQAVVTTSANHGYAIGDTVTMAGIALGTTNNMQLLNEIQFTIVAVTANTFTINWNTNQSSYTAISGATATVKKVLFPFLYPPQDNVINSISFSGTQITVATAMYHNLETGNQIAFRIPTFWGATQLNSLPNGLIPGQPLYAYVSSVTDNWTFVCQYINNATPASSPAYTTNATMTSSTILGLTFAQVLAVGDVNSGGNGISLTTGSALYPSPQYPTFNNRIFSINGPSIRGAFTNNTAQGFIIGNGTPQQQAGTGTIVTSGSEIMWRAYLSDYANP